MNKQISLSEIFIAFLYSGLILLGGGYVILPILQNELVKKRGWLTEEDLTDYYAVSQSLPGLLSINIAILTGYKLRGKFGALAGVLGITFFAFWAIVFISSIISRFISNVYVQGAFWAIEIAVCILIISAVREMWPNAVKDKTGFLLFFVMLVLMLFTNISPVYLIIFSIIFGILYKSWEQRKDVE